MGIVDLTDVYACRDAFVKKVKEEMSSGLFRVSLRKHWAGESCGFRDKDVQNRWLDFHAGWEAKKEEK
jgi:hypothetical protein